MTKLRKNIVTASLVGVMAFGMAACGGDDGDTGTEAPAGTSTEAPAGGAGGATDAPLNGGGGAATGGGMDAPTP